ncbi:hypothetical protein Tsubulata_050145, partial [Turnera subulata]
MVMEGTTSAFFSSGESDFSSGYLEDALLEFSQPSKRRRFLLNTVDNPHETKSQYWNRPSCDDWEMSENFSCMSHFANFHGATSG